MDFSLDAEFKDMKADIQRAIELLREENEKKDAIIKQQAFKIEQLISEIMVLRSSCGRQ